MTRDELEALTWRTLSRYGRPDPADVTALLSAADKYATDLGGITAERRKVLAEAYTGAMHFLDDSDKAACRPSAPRRGHVTSTTDPADVTCRSCQKTTAYLEELGRRLVTAGA